MLPSASALASRREERVRKAFSFDHHGPGDARLSHSAKGIYGELGDTVLHDYVEAGGRIAPSRRGAHAKTESFLDDIDLKKDATAWLRANVQAGRKKPTNNEHPVPPLNVRRFHKWVNDTLLKEILEADSRRKPISESTACRWLHVRLA